MTTAPTVQTTVVGSYPLPEWLRAYPTRDHLRNATVVAVRPEELAGLAVLSDGELSRFDVDHPETNGMIDYLVGQMDGVSTRITAADADAFRRQQGKGYRAAPAAVVAGLPLDRRTSPKHVAADVGGCPRETSSGGAVRGRRPIGAFGPAHLRRAVSLPAIVARRSTPHVRPCAARRRATGTPATVVTVAVLRTLLLPAWTLLRTGPALAPPQRPAPPATPATPTTRTRRRRPPPQSPTQPAGT